MNSRNLAGFAPRILVVTARPGAVDYVETLRSLGYRTQSSVNASEIQSLLEAGWRPDLAILDSSLSRPAIAEIYAQLRTIRLAILHIVPAIQLPQFQQETDLRLLPDAFLAAPFEMDALLNRIEELLLRNGIEPLLRAATAPSPGSKLAEAEPGEPAGLVVAVFSTKGGVGKTTLAVNLAATIAQSVGAEVLLADCDLNFGSVAAVLNLPNRPTWLDTLDFAGSRSPDVIADAIVPYSQGLTHFGVLVPPEDPLEARLLKSQHIMPILLTARRYFDCLIVDLHHSYDDLTLAILDIADVILLVTTPEISNVQNTRNFLELADRFEYADKVLLIVNRANAGLDLTRFQEVVGRRVSGWVESAGRQMVDAANAGVPVVLRDRTAQVSQDIQQVVALLSVSRARRRRGAPAEERRSEIQSLISSMRVRLPKASSSLD